MSLTLSINNTRDIHTLNFVEKVFSYGGMLPLICIPVALVTIAYSVCNIALSEVFGYFETKKVTKLRIDLETETDETKKVELNKEIEESSSKINGYIQSREKGYYLIHLAIFQLVLPIIGNVITYQRYIQNELARKNAEELKNEETTQGEDLDKKIQHYETTIKNLSSQNEDLKKKTEDLNLENEKISNEKTELEKQNDSLTFTYKSLKTSLNQPKDLSEHNIFKKKVESEEIGKLKDEIKKLQGTISNSLEINCLNKIYSIILKHIQTLKETDEKEVDSEKKGLYKIMELKCDELKKFYQELYEQVERPTVEQIEAYKIFGERCYGYVIYSDETTKIKNSTTEFEKNNNEETSKKTLLGEIKKVFTPGGNKTPKVDDTENPNKTKNTSPFKLNLSNLNLLKKKGTGEDTPIDGTKTPKVIDESTPKEKTGNKTPREEKQGNKTPRGNNKNSRDKAKE